MPPSPSQKVHIHHPIFFDSFFIHSSVCFHLIIQESIVDFGIILTMESLHGFLRIRVIRGINLAIRDAPSNSSDPYVVIKLGEQKLKTAVGKNVNPEWNEDLTLCIADPNHPISLVVYDYDRFSKDDRMGEAEFDIIPLVEAVQMRSEQIFSSGTVVTQVTPSKDNCLAGDSYVMYKDGYVVQDMRLRLQNVESSEVELQLQWIDLPGGSIGLS